MTGFLTTRMKSKVAAGAMIGALSIALGACATTEQPTPGQDDGAEKYTIVMSNSDASISWRQQMLNGVQYVADSKYADEVDYTLKQSESTVTSQIASLQQIIRSAPDALIVDAASDTALDVVLQQACDAGIVVVNFDQLAPDVTCTAKLTSPSVAQATDAAKWMCAELGGEGTILLDQAIAGTSIATAQNEEVRRVLAEDCPGITISGTYQSMYSPGPEKAAISSLLTSDPDISGVISLAYCSSVISTFQEAGRDPVPTTCVASNGNMTSCSDNEVPCFMWALSPVIGAIALQEAVDILDGKKLDTRVQTPIALEYVMNSTVDYPHVLERVVPVLGTDFFEDASPDLIVPQTFGDFEITPNVAMTGKK